MTQRGHSTASTANVRAKSVAQSSREGTITPGCPNDERGARAAASAPFAALRSRGNNHRCTAGREHAALGAVRLEGTGITCFRQREFGANTPWKRTSGCHGGGTNAARRARHSTGVITRCVWLDGSSRLPTARADCCVRAEWREGGGGNEGGGGEDGCFS